MKIAVAMRTRNSHDIIISWIGHYINLGFDEIHICDNCSEPSIKDFLESNAPNLIDKVSITTDPIIGVDGQPVHYNKILAHSKENNIDFLLCADDDEFINLRQNISLKRFLEKFSKDTAVISMNWVTFGQGGRKKFDHSKLVHEQFIYREDYRTFWNYFVKSFVRVNLIETINNFHKCDSGSYKSVNVYGEEISSGSNRPMSEVERERNKLDDKTPMVMHHYMTLDKESMKNKHIRSKVRFNDKRIGFGQYSEQWYHGSHPQGGFKDNVKDESMLKYVSDIKKIIDNR